MHSYPETWKAAMGMDSDLDTVLKVLTAFRAGDSSARMAGARAGGGVAEALDAVLDRAQELEQFSHALCHDLRGPLRHVEGFLGQVEGFLEGEEGWACLAGAWAATRHMNQLIDGLLGCAGLSHAPMACEPVDLDGLVRSLLPEARAGFPDRAIEWRVGALPTVDGDPDLLRAAFRNLLDNAGKFTRQRPRAVVEVGLAGGAPGEWRVFVRDNGCGFDPALGHKLFGVFQRLHAQDEFPGTGIGLASVRRIVERHRGRVWAEGRPGAGATFYLAFPRPAP